MQTPCQLAHTRCLLSILATVMGLGITSSVMGYYYGRAASAGSTRTLLLSTTTGRPPGASVLYIDRGVIVLNKPPGLVSQGTSRVVLAPVAAKSHHRQETTTLPRRTAFDDVLDGTVYKLFSLLLRLLGWNVSALTRRRRLTDCSCSSHSHIQVSGGPMASVQIRIRSIDWTRYVRNGT